MADDLKGKRVAILATDGFEQVELTAPREAIEQAGATTDLVAPHGGMIQGMNHRDAGDQLEVDVEIAKARPDDYDALVLPGGVVNGDHLRMDERSVEFVKSIGSRGKPIGVICHGGWVLIEAGLVRGKTLTSYPSLKTDMQNAGATWVDEEVHVDHGLVSSRRPDDLRAFCPKLVEEIAEGRHEQNLAA
jgi:deglycase